MGVAIVVVLAGAAYAVFGFLERRAYANDVAADALRRGLEVSSLQYSAHWPLDYYLPRLRTAQSPEAADSIVSDADSTAYFVVPMTASFTDSALVQVFYFRVGRRTNAIQAQFLPGRLTGLEGADWLPERQYRRAREQALVWYRTRTASPTLRRD
jgi:hypothetical protein